MKLRTRFRLMKITLLCQDEYRVRRHGHANQQRVGAPASDVSDHVNLLILIPDTRNKKPLRQVPLWGRKLTFPGLREAAASLKNS